MDSTGQSLSLDQMPKAKKSGRLYAIIVTVIAVLSIAAFAFVFIHAGYHTKVLVKLGLKEPTVKPNNALMAWENCLEKLDYDADVVFFGDSITRGSDFGACFPDTRIVNLGYGGDTLAGMRSRIPMVQAVSPEKVFILGGINGLTDSNLEQCVSWYTDLVNELQEALPDAQLYIQSVLPVSKEKEVTLTNVCHNETIVAFNARLQQLAQEQDMVYIDLFSLYEKDGQLDPALTSDGIHLKPEAYTYWEAAVREFIEP